MTIEDRVDELRVALEDVRKAGSAPILNTDNHAWVVAKSIKLDRAEMRAKNLSYDHMPAILDALAAKNREIERLRGALEKTDKFIEYARYELEEDGGDWKMFPDQKDADAHRVIIAEALNPPKEGGRDGK